MVKDLTSTVTAELFLKITWALKLWCSPIIRGFQFSKTVVWLKLSELNTSYITDITKPEVKSCFAELLAANSLWTVLYQTLENLFPCNLQNCNGCHMHCLSTASSYISFEKRVQAGVRNTAGAYTCTTNKPVQQLQSPWSCSFSITFSPEKDWGTCMSLHSTMLDVFSLPAWYDTLAGTLDRQLEVRCFT